MSKQFSMNDLSPREIAEAGLTKREVKEFIDLLNDCPPPGPEYDDAEESAQV